jgi:DNA polymerase sigma
MVEPRSPIESYVERVSPTDEQMDILIKAYELIRLMIRKDAADLNMLMYGSTINGLMTMGKHSSDLDLTVINEN